MMRKKKSADDNKIINDSISEQIINEQNLTDGSIKPNLKEKVVNDVNKSDNVKADDNKQMDNSILNEIIKNHKAFKDLESRINTNADKWTDKSFLLIQGRINALMELIARNELSYINEIKDPKKFLETKLFNEQRFTLLKLNIDLLAKVIKSDEDVNETVDIEQLMEAFRF